MPRPSTGKGKGKGQTKGNPEQGPNFNVALVNHGGRRARAGDLYIADLYNMPATIIMACEMD